MVTDAKIEIFEGNVNCDRYHLLRPKGIVSGPFCHVEEGKSFTGFDNEFIINQSYEIVKFSRMARITLKGFNFDSEGVEHPIYCLINNIRPLRYDKTIITLEPDAWMNYRDRVKVGDMNHLFEITKVLPDYPFYEYTGKFKYFDPIWKRDIFYNKTSNILVLVHKEGSIDQGSQDEDWIYYMESLNEDLSNTRYFYMSMWSLFNHLHSRNVDTNQIISVFLSPFQLGLDPSSADVSTENDKIWRLKLESFQTVQTRELKVQEIQLYNSPDSKTCILDMSGAVVWQAEYKDIGNKLLKARLDVSFDDCKWNCFIDDIDSTNRIQLAPDRRFTILCNSISFFADYYQQYINLERSFNVEKRNAQYDKQQLDAIGDVVASTLWHGTSSGMPAEKSKGATIKGLPVTSAYAMGGAFIGGSAQIIIQDYALGEYNKKLDNIENRQAKLQYDKYNATGNSVMDFVCGATKPCLIEMRVDQQTFNSKKKYGEPLVTYNCDVKGSDVYQWITSENDYPKYLSADIDFYDIPLNDALQLNTRFKNGVEFVEWK